MPATGAAAQRPAPSPGPGADQGEILRSVGYTDAEIEAMGADGAFGLRPVQREAAEPG